MELSKFLVAYRINDDYWWTLSLGDAQVLFDAAVERMETAEAQLAAVRAALGGYPDSDLVSLATTLRARVDAVNLDAARLAGAVQEAGSLLSLAQPRPGVTPEWQPRYSRWLAANSTTSAELDAAVDSHTVDALARRVEALEGFVVTVNRAAAKQIEIEERDREQVRALQGIVRKLDDATAEQVARLIERVEALEAAAGKAAGADDDLRRQRDVLWRAVADIAMVNRPLRPIEDYAIWQAVAFECIDTALGAMEEVSDGGANS